jgi:hypothetical protein
MSENNDTSGRKIVKPNENGENPVDHPDRRRFLTLGIGAAAGLTGFGSGYSLSRPDRKTPKPVSRNSRIDPPGSRKFKVRKQALLDRHHQQTREQVSRLKTKYEKPIFGHARVWDLIERLALCVDPTDDWLYCTSQFIHVQQMVAAMERDGITDPDLFLTAFTHDLGKVTLLTDELPENIVGQARPIGELEEGIGFDQVIYQFCHPEIIYLRLKDHVANHVAWLLRYHNISIAASTPYMNAQDRNYAKKYLETFQKYDTGFKSYTYAPDVDLKKYRELIEQTFPNPILF